MFFKKKSIQQEFNDIADKYKDENVEVAIIMYSIAACIGSDKILKGNSLSRLSQMAGSLAKENLIRLKGQK